MPKEAEGGFDARDCSSWQWSVVARSLPPSARFVWRKNPNYYVTGRPFPDRLERPIIPELAQQLAQFRAGNIYTDIVANAQQER